MNKALFNIRSLSGGYGRKIVLDNITFNVSRGEFLGIIGPNGSGKTTLLKMLSKILKPVSGSILYNGLDINNIGIKELAREMAYVSQETSGAFSFTALEVVLMGRYPHLSRFQMETKGDYEIARASLAVVGCADLCDHDLDEISSGEKQRVMIARALAQEPGVLILDEPTSRLDIGHQIEIFDVIKKLNRDKDLTVISVLHDLNLASDYCDRLILINEGRIFKEGSVEDVLTYQNIESVYKTTVVVNPSAATTRPHITLLPKYKSQ